MTQITTKQVLRFQIVIWTLGIIVCVVGIVAWGQDYDWKLTPLTGYMLFPLLGILAYSLMWTHYVTGALQEFFGFDKKAVKAYFEYSGYAVLVLLLMHPGLLILQRFRDGYGLPPESYKSYVAPGLGWITVLGSISLLVFLAYEFHRKYGQRSWWKYILTAVDIAMLAIFYHGLQLGGQLVQGSWFRTVWVFYGLVLIVILLRKYYLKLFAGSQRPRI